MERYRTVENRHHLTVDTFLFTHHGLPFSVDYRCAWVDTCHIEEVRFALASNAPLDRRPLVPMLERNEVAMLHETIVAHTTDGRPTKQLCDEIDEANNVHTNETSAEYGYGA